MKKIIFILSLLCNTLVYAQAVPTLKLTFKYTADDNTTFQRDLRTEFRGLSNDFDDGFDEFMTDQQPSDLGLKTYQYPNQPLVVSAIEDFNNTLEIPLLLYLDKDRTVNFKATPENMPSTNIYIKDVVDKQYYNITGSNISVGLNLPTGTYTDRFFITFKIESLSLLDGYTVNELTTFIDTTNKELVIKQLGKKVEDIKVYSLLGKEVLAYKNNKASKELRYSTTSLKKGIYIVKLKTTNGLIVTKKINV